MLTFDSIQGDLLPIYAAELSKIMGRRFSLRLRQLPNCRSSVIEVLDMSDIAGWQFPTVVWVNPIGMSDDQMRHHVQIAFEALVEKLSGSRMAS